MATTYEAIATVEVTSATAASMDFTGITADYTDLAIALSVRGTLNSGSGVIYLEFNGDTTSTNYQYRRLLGDGSAASSASGSSKIIDVLQGDNATANTFGSEYIYIPNYAGSNYKSASNDFVGENNGTLAYSGLIAYLWNNTAAITSIKLTGNGSFKQYSTATLYGIKNS